VSKQHAGLAPAPDFPATSTARDWQQHRAGLYKLPVQVDCPECGGLGWLKDERTRQAVRCQTCTEPERRAWLVRHCGLEESQLDYSLDDWRLGEWEAGKQAAYQEQRRQARGAMEQVIERRTGLLTLWGDFGSGKTLALQIVTNELRGRLVESYYVPLAFVLDHLRELYAQAVEWSDYWQRLLDVPCLCLDEVTRFYETDWAVERLWMLMDKRYQRRTSHLTVLATNNDPRQRLPTSEAIGYLYSRCRQGTLVELRGDMRAAAPGPPIR